MEPCTLTVGTVTRALAARRLLSAARIPARMVKTAGSKVGGCAYALVVAAADMPKAVEILGDNKISFEWSRGEGR
ncbi:MAG: DUF3343 domain-containing protein [Clostridia bacterium]|nr:DUF3343 domain-containing protein [Clostridia bacterium]